MNGYSETLDYLYGLEKFGMVFGLDNVRWILSLIENPQDAIKTVHVAGTNGKGSVAAMLSRILRTARLRNRGLYVPASRLIHRAHHYQRRAITEAEVVDLARFIKGRIDEADPARSYTFFDFTTALAFLHFRRKGVDIAIVEVGLGGRLDSTNVINPLVSVITNVDYDHQEYLGNTIEQIAGEKAGVIKEGVPVVTGAEGKALGVIKAAAANTVLYAMGEAFTYKKKGDQLMWYRGVHRTYDELSLALRGDHQLFNAALVLCAAELLGDKGFNLNEYTVRKGLSSAVWPGRLEVVKKTGRPLVLIDGAHNPQGISSLASYLRGHFLNRKKILIFGVMKDKDFVEMIKTLLPLVDRTILTRPETSRAALPVDVAAYAPGALVTATVAEAVEAAFKVAQERDLIIVTGSFYTVGEAKKLLDEP